MEPWVARPLWILETRFRKLSPVTAGEYADEEGGLENLLVLFLIVGPWLITESFLCTNVLHARQLAWKLSHSSGSGFHRRQPYQLGQLEITWLGLKDKSRSISIGVDSESLAGLFVLKLLRRAERWHWHSLFLLRALANRHQPWVLVDGRFGKIIQILICSMQQCEYLFTTSLAKELICRVLQTLSLPALWTQICCCCKIQPDFYCPFPQVALSCLWNICLSSLAWILLAWCNLGQASGKWVTCFSWIAHLGKEGPALLEPQKNKTKLMTRYHYYKETSKRYKSSGKGKDFEYRLTCSTACPNHGF